MLVSDLRIHVSRRLKLTACGIALFASAVGLEFDALAKTPIIRYPLRPLPREAVPMIAVFEVWADDDFDT